MNIIQKATNINGSRPPIIQNYHGSIPCDWIVLIPNIDTSAMQTHQGFVDLTIQNNQVTAITGNDKAYQAYLSSLPAPEPPKPTETELIQQTITDLELKDISQGQQITELELMILEAKTSV